MTTPELVRRLVSQFNEESLLHQAQEWSTAPRSTCKDVLRTIKRIIKDKKQLPAQRLMALKVIAMQLLHCCLQTSNPDFVQFTAAKLLKRLTILGTHRKESKDHNRGEDLFGQISLLSYQSRQASSEFLVRLLIYMKEWAAKYGEIEGVKTGFYYSYWKLVNFGVAFPDSESVLKDKTETVLTPNDIEKATRTARLLADLMTKWDADMTTARQLADKLIEILGKIETELGKNAGEEGNEEYVAQLCEVNDYIRGVMEGYESRKKQGPVGTKNRLLSASVPVGTVGLEVNPEPELEFKQQELTRLHEQLSQARQEATQLSDAINLRATIHSPAMSLPFHQRELSDSDLDTRRKIDHLKGKMKNWERELKERETEHRVVLKALCFAQEENERLKRELAAFSGTSPDFSDSPDFETVRSPCLSSVPALILKPEISLFAQRVPDNLSFFRSNFHSNSGVLFSNFDLEIGFSFDSQHKCRLYIGNKLKSEVCQLQTFICNSDLEGLKVEIDKEMEELPLFYMNKTKRVLEIEQNGVFFEIPRVIITYE